MNPDDRTARALNALDGLPPTARRALTAVIPLLLVAALVATFAIAPSGRGGNPPARRSAGRNRAAHAPVLQAPRPAPVAAARDSSLSAATDSALRFLRGYLAYSYGRGRPQAIRAADPQVIAALRQARPRVPPATGRRRPRITSLQVLAQAPGTAQATATITDGSGLQYPLVFYLDRRPSGWTVTRLADD
jgi:hypothetical protein